VPLAPANASTPQSFTDRPLAQTSGSFVMSKAATCGNALEASTEACEISEQSTDE
jgi:hypothetical protein